MSFSTVYSRSLSGVAAHLITVETHLSNGLPGMSIVGLPETAVRESKDRVRGAILNSQFDFPLRRITINLAPADLPKEGSWLDLPIALGILSASGQIVSTLFENYEFAGELALNGSIRKIQGIVPMAIQCAYSNRSLIIPNENADEASLIKQLNSFSATHLLDVCAHITEQKSLVPITSVDEITSNSDDNDLADVRGQQHAKRALEIAAAGNHSLLMVGTPGTGKTMLASRIPSILPPMDESEALETAAILSISNNGFSIEQWKRRPFRAPHHTASGVALVGGGSRPRPGEISLAHNGVMFLDELPEFDRRVLEVLREPLESGKITISRAARNSEFYAKFQLIAAMNPCPCGYFGHKSGRCHCSADQIQRYRSRISGPLLDRIDMHVEVLPVSYTLLHPDNTQQSETSEQVRMRVTQARQLQTQRCQCLNAYLSNKHIDTVCRLKPIDYRLLDEAIEKFGLSARAYHRILKVARTIADLAQSDSISSQHLMEAISFRKLDRVEPKQF